MKVKRYAGAGVLLVAKGQNGPECYLGSRKESGIWSIMGGGAEAEDRGDLFLTACRELSQEAVTTGFGGRFTTEFVRPRIVDTISFNFYFFTWKTFVVLVEKDAYPDFRLNDEFTRGAWMSMRQLPGKIHFLLRWPFLNWRRLGRRVMAGL